MRAGTRWDEKTRELVQRVEGKLKEYRRRSLARFERSLQH
jgi:hypothetical protein